MSLAICPSCGWGAATSDGYCLECVPPDDGMEPWERCGCAACQDTMAQLYGEDEDESEPAAPPVSLPLHPEQEK